MGHGVKPEALGKRDPHAAMLGSALFPGRERVQGRIRNQIHSLEPVYDKIARKHSLEQEDRSNRLYQTARTMGARQPAYRQRPQRPALEVDFK